MTAITLAATGTTIIILLTAAAIAGTIAGMRINYDAENEDAARRRILRELARHQEKDTP